MTRSVLRYVKHRITQQPDTCMTFEAECMTCDWKAKPSTDGAGVDVQCMSHTGRTGHATVRRSCTSLALVERAE
ncbi:DUF7848 domain-containing protein [Streptomyces sp. 46]|uniref:DUF7848 domain-containing protein n=1 Tax=Streptomyces sp. 46 TaxID=1777322 RepID=UPI000CF1D1FD|nr:hypothetical protein BV882_38885 [Streptomyces sp. 46]